MAAEVFASAIEMFSQIAGDRMQIELSFADQLVPTGKLFQAMRPGDDSMASMTEAAVFGGDFPFASRYSPDVPIKFNK